MKILKTLLLGLALLVASASFAQEAKPNPNTETLQVDITKLSQSQLYAYQEMKKLQAGVLDGNATAKLLDPDNVDRYSYAAKAFGQAIGAGLSAVSTNVESFAQTSAGKTIMFLVAWKVMGKDSIEVARKIIKVSICVPVGFIGLFTWIYFFRKNCMSRQTIESIEQTGLFKKKVKYTGNWASADGERQSWYGVALGVFLGILALITFL